MSLKPQYVLNRKKHCTYQPKRCHLHQFKITKSSFFQQSINNQVWLKYKEKQVAELISETNLYRRINKGNSSLSNSDNRFNRKYKCYKRHNRFCMHSLKLGFVFLQIDQINENKILQVLLSYKQKLWQSNCTYRLVIFMLLLSKYVSRVQEL